VKHLRPVVILLSNTYFYILDENNNVLQRIQYHTSCSAPIVLLDTIGAVQLTGYLGDAPGAPVIKAPEPVYGVDADTLATSVPVVVGDEVTFTYVVTNLGKEELEILEVTDDNHTPNDPSDDFNPDAIVDDNGFNVGDLDKDNLLDVTEEWLYEATTTAEFGYQTNVGTVTAESQDGTTLTHSDTGNYMGMFPGDANAGLGDFVFEDTNGNGIQDAGETGIEGVAVTLTGGGADGVIGTGDDDTTETTTTDGNGLYLFEGLNPGEQYKVTFEQPDGFSGVSPFQEGEDSSVDSDANPDNGLMSDVVILESGEFNDTIDAGFFKQPGIVIDKYTSGDGDEVAQDADQPSGPEIPVGDIATFTYKVRNTGETQLVDVVVTDDNGTPDDTSDDFNPTFVDGDLNENGIFDPGEQWIWTANRTVTEGQYTNIGKVTATDPNTGEMVMDDDPSNHFGVIIPGSIGNFVFHDVDRDGIQDSGELGIVGALVKLLDGSGGFLEQTTTDEDGFYLFTDLNPGDYQVMFVNPEGFDEVSPFLVGNNSEIDSDANPNNNLTSSVISLANGENNLTIDAGFFQTPASLGDFVFEDTNGNGIQDEDEPGVEGVTVKLQNPDGSAVLDGEGNPITTTTAADGSYAFTGLIPGEYKVMFVAPEGFEFTTPNVGDDDALDSDADPNMNGMTQTVTLTAGEFNGTLDAGLIQPASLGNFVFDDTNGDGIQNNEEAGVANVTVTLTGGGEDGVIGTGGDDTTEILTTDANGLYLFEDLNPGEEYKVTFSDLPEGFVFTQQNQGGDDALDSDADPTNGMTQIVTLSSGEENLTLDAGIVESDDPAENKTVINGTDGSDSLTGGTGDENIFGFDGSDTIDGGAGDDCITGSRGNPMDGMNEEDFLTGGEGADTFVVGEMGRFFYDKNGRADCAVIEDFSVDDMDQIQLAGSAIDYTIEFGTNAFGNNFVEISHNGDLVALVRNLTQGDLNELDSLTSDSYVYVG
jgi:hypothetical protein